MQTAALIIFCFFGAWLVRFILNRKTRFVDLFIEPGFTLVAMLVFFILFRFIGAGWDLFFKIFPQFGPQP
jgi:hypothetical protein